jgi:hypothetical protein
MVEVNYLLFETLGELGKIALKVYREQRSYQHRRHRLHPGPETPLWNQLASEIRPHLRRYGTQVGLGRVVGLPRQQIHAYFIRRDRMPDAERTLQFLIWLAMLRTGRRLR